MPRFFGSVAALVGTYVVVMIAAALWLPHEWDWAAFGWLSSRVPPAFSPQVKIVDVTWKNADPAGNRRRLAAFLSGLDRLAENGNEKPNAVVLDFEFAPCPGRCEGDMAASRAELIESIRAATPYFPVFAVIRLDVDRDDEARTPPLSHDTDIYSALTGSAQTNITAIPGRPDPVYRVCYANVPVADENGVREGTENLWAMVVRVLDAPTFSAGAPECETRQIAVRVGPRVPLAPPVVYAFTGQTAFPAYPQLDKSYVIVGALEQDVSPYTDRSGPELVGWAFSNALDQGSLVGRETYYDAQPPNALLLLIVPAFSGFAVVGYLAIFYQLKRTRLRRLRHVLPWISSGLAIVFGIGVFAGFEWLSFVSHHLQPQVSLVSCGVVLASGLCGVRGFQLLEDESNAIDPVPNETYDYDVFISYAHDEGAWVYENVYVPFRDAVLANGEKLSIFFDRSSIRTGTGWQTKLALAIDGSRFVVPVYSDVYFSRPYCRFEIMRAHRKWVVAGDESRCVLPIARGNPKIHPTVNDIQARSIDEHPDLVQQLVAEIVERRSRTLQEESQKNGAAS